MSRVHDEAPDQSRIVDVLRRRLGEPAPLTTHHNATNDKMYSAAVHATRRRENVGTGTSAFLPTGSPCTTRAAAERAAINSARIEAAWSLARRTVRDTCCLVAMDRDTVDQVIKDVDDTFRGMSTSEDKASPAPSDNPERRSRHEDTHGSRSQNSENAVRKLRRW